MESSFIIVDYFDCDSNEPDAPVVTVDVKVRGALYTFLFRTDTGQCNHSMLGEYVVYRYLVFP